ncbi:MAG: hypothetical protein KBT35_07265, partial [Firmicutes bacterium]|nr:hypothetical protein [Candidatus Colivicinus equi]
GEYVKKSIENNNMYNNKYYSIVKDIDSFDFQQQPKDKRTKFYQYDKTTLQLINIYESIDELKKDFLYANVWRACNKKRKTAYGYIWSNTLI